MYRMSRQYLLKERNFPFWMLIIIILYFILFPIFYLSLPFFLSFPPFSKVTPELVCGRSYLDVGLLKSQLAAKRLDSSSAHLADPRCSSQERNGTVWFQVERREGSCGTTLTVRTRLLYIFLSFSVVLPAFL